MTRAATGSLRLEAAEGLACELPGAGPGRVAWGEPDWLGPLGLRLRRTAGADKGDWLGGGVGPADAPDAHRLQARAAPAHEGEDALGRFQRVVLDWGLPLPVRTCVRAYRDRPLLVFRSEATGGITGLATGSLAEPSLAWPRCLPRQRAGGGLPADTRGFGHQYTEFALPTFSDDSLAGFFLLPFRPAVVMPLWLVAPDGRSLLLAPLDAFHEQVVAVPANTEQAEDGVRCGWHGDLDEVPAGFASELGVWAGPGPRAVLEAWTSALRARHATLRPSRYADAGVGKLSYWTDNGAAYWYRSEPDRDVPGTLEGTARALRDARVPCEAFQLDSWFYPHEALRPFDTPEIEVPPSPMLRWEARSDVLPDGIHALRERLGRPPLILHSRHLASASPYFAGDGDGIAAWHDGERAHPVDPAFFRRFMAQAASWGAITFEQDWLIEMFLGVRGLRERPGRARAWQEGVDCAAAEHGVTLQWCMPSPADFLQTLTLRRVTSIRTSGDYRYIIGNGPLWCWFLLTNAWARALGLHPFKDVFLSSREGTGHDGDPCAEAEALLAALSAGPVGLGDRLGRTDRDLVLRTCREDGLLVKPDVPLAALDRCYRESPFQGAAPLVGETYSRHPVGCWTYLVAMNASPKGKPLRFRVELAELGPLAPEDDVLAYDWRTGSFERLAPGAGLHFALEPLDWSLKLLAPVLPGEVALFGDTSRYASMGDRRVRALAADPRGLVLEVSGAPGERVGLRGWSAGAVVSPQGLERDDATGVFRVAVTIPDRGWEPVRITRA